MKNTDFYPREVSTIFSYDHNIGLL